MRAILKATLQPHGRDVQVGIEQQPAGALHAQALAIASGAQTHVLLEAPLELAPPDAQRLAQLRDGHRGVQLLLQHEHGLVHHGVGGALGQHGLGLQRGGRQRLVLDHDAQRLGGAGTAQRALDQVGRQVDHAGAAGAGQPVPVHDEHAVGHHAQLRKLRHELVAVEPAHAGQMAVQQTGTGKHERAGTQAHQPLAQAGSIAQEGLRLRPHPGTAVQQPAHHDHAVPGLCRPQRGGGHHRGAATRHDGLAAEHLPADQPLAAAVALVRGQAQGVDKTRIGGEREARRQHKGHPQQRLTIRLGHSALRGAGRCAR